MQTIKVVKDELLGILRQNREDHRVIYQEALAGFRAKAAAELEAALASVSNQTEDVRITCRAPEDHTKDYDRIIAMLEMSVDGYADLTEEQFAQYVQDDWAWQRSFLSNVYGSPRARGKFADSYVVS